MKTGFGLESLFGGSSFDKQIQGEGASYSNGPSGLLYFAIKATTIACLGMLLGVHIYI